ncbi:MAG: MarR family winged helix-turn-helix transcriptional regulator [Planctomycetes bacterium]|nr:MarR family winged helix-turn-helix transcriptional regulator [Planctomycetota bacterium]
MPVLPVTHNQWQVLRAVKRSRKPPLGRELRLSPTRGTKDGTFLTNMVRLGLLTRVSGSDKDPFEATYSLTESGKHAAEYGECDFPSDMLISTPTAKPQGKN